MDRRTDVLKIQVWALIGLTALAYWPVLTAGFINYDDASFTFQNPHVFTGLTLANAKWAFSTLNGDTTSYQPLTWLSHQLDCQLFGSEPRPQHLTNLWLHIINTLLLFRILAELTRKLWRSFTVAALFAVHPLHVESVAWISERKTLLCFFFWLLTIVAYFRFVRLRSFKNYLVVVLLYAAALLSKPIAVTLPVTLLLLDFWPGKRFSPSAGSRFSSTLAQLVVKWKAKGGWLTGRGTPPRYPMPTSCQERLLLEKAPLFLMSGLGCWLTVVSQADLGATKSLTEVCLSARCANSLVAPAVYLRKTFWPSDLAPIYPLRQNWPLWLVAACGLMWLTITLWVILASADRPYLFVGWAWFVVSLLPTIGLVQVGLQGMADRYSYIPLIGIFLAIVWGLAELAESLRCARLLLGTSVAVAIAACVACTLVVARYWRSSLSLFGHAVRVTDRNYIAYHQLGMAYKNRGNLSEAERMYRESVRIEPSYYLAYVSLGNLLLEEKECRAALDQFSLALGIKPHSPQTHATIARFFAQCPDAQMRDPQKALNHARLACQLTRYRKIGLIEELARICAENGLFQEANKATQMALDLSAGSIEMDGAKQLLTDVRKLEMVNK